MTTFHSRSPRAGIPAVSVRAILPDSEITGGIDLVISGASADPERIEPGHAFVAIDDFDGLDTIRAIDRGAVGVISDRHLPECGLVQVIVGNPRSALATIAHSLAGEPSRGMPVVGVTGGRASEAAAHFLRSILEADGRRVGVTGQHSGPADAFALNHDLATIHDRGCDLAIAHIPPSALEDRIADGLVLEAALIASDGHATRGEARSYSKLARRVRSGGILSIDASDSEAMLLPASKLDVRELTFGIENGATVHALVEQHDLDATRLHLMGLDQERTVELPPIGEVALRAAIGAVAIAKGLGATDDAIVAGLESVAFDPGRREPIAAVLWPRALAHTMTDHPDVVHATAEMHERRAG